MNDILLIITICLYSLMLIVGVKRLEGSSSLKIVLAVTDIVMTGVSLLLLGLSGIFIGIVIAVVSGLVISVKSAMDFESVCASVSTTGRFRTTKDAERFVRELYPRHEGFGLIGLMGLANLVLRLAERGRSPAEIELMASVISDAIAITKLPIEEAVDVVDAAVRRRGLDASDTRRLTDVALKASQLSPMTFQETLTSLAKV